MGDTPQVAVDPTGRWYAVYNDVPGTWVQFDTSGCPSKAVKDLPADWIRLIPLPTGPALHTLWALPPTAHELIRSAVEALAGDVERVNTALALLRSKLDDEQATAGGWPGCLAVSAPPAPAPSAARLDRLTVIPDAVEVVPVGFCRQCGNPWAAAPAEPATLDPAAGPDPYATWDPGRATDEPDGLPDRAIVPLVEHLRALGIVTLQSCAGHQGSDGTLWVRADTVDPVAVRWLPMRPFDRMQRVVWPEDRWEFHWRPDHAQQAIDVLYALQPPPAASRPNRTTD